MHSIASDDTEITLGVGKLLGLFFLLAAICGIFFSIGYSLGKSSGREQALNDQPASAAVSSDTPSSTSSSPKPTAAINLKQDNHAPTTEDANSSGQQGSLTFYNAVKQDNNAASRSGAERGHACSKGSGGRNACSDQG